MVLSNLDNCIIYNIDIKKLRGDLMKKLIIVLLSLVFLFLLYLNFLHENKSNVDNNNNTSQVENSSNSDNQKDKNDHTNKEDDGKEEASTSENNVSSEPLIFNEDVIQEKYDANIQNNEPLTVDVVLPTYYSDAFMNDLKEAFNNTTIEFNRIDIDVNSGQLAQLNINDSADVVLLSALQIQDYNEEVLPSHDLPNVLRMYMSLLEANKTAVILSEPNAHAHVNLQNVLEDDQAFMRENDYFYVDNSRIELDDMYDYDQNVLTREAEKEVAKNIRDFFLQ